MKKICALSVFVLLAAVAAFGWGPQKLAVDVPFDFYVGNEAMPAGTYVIGTDTANSGRLTVESRNHGHQVVAATTPAGQSVTGKSELVFSRVGETYFLAKIWNGTSNTGRQLAVSATQREMSKATQTEPRQLALVVQR